MAEQTTKQRTTKPRSARERPAATKQRPAATKGRADAPSQSELATATTEIVTQMARTAAGELVKGQQPLGDVARTVAAEAVQTLDKRGPKLVEDAGILNWRYALLGWMTWQVGKRVARRKAMAALGRRSKRGSANGSRRNGGEGGDDG